VDWDNKANKAMSVAPVKLPQRLDSSFRYVPVVFITQRSLAKLTDSSIRRLATNINNFTALLCRNSYIDPAEIQIDCDWTPGTKNVYFQLLRLLKAQPYFTGKTLSCTIRMHQAKYTNSNGIPPVDKGMLMCYNMGDLKNAKVQNSIIDVGAVQQYLSRLQYYPLKLDIALPIFDWCLQFRQDQFKGILRGVTPGIMDSNKAFAQIDGHKYSSLHDTLWQGYYFEKGDVVRAEQADITVLKIVAGYTARHISNTDLNVVFFHCDSITLSKYSPDELEKVFNIYR
jgi:hypothetical protein